MGGSGNVKSHSRSSLHDSLGLIILSASWRYVKTKSCIH